MKVCNMCNRNLPDTCFAVRKSTGNLVSYCAVCKRLYDRCYWAATKARRLSQKRINQKGITLRNKAYIKAYLLSHLCIKCGEKDPVVLDFHHKRGLKKLAISNMVASYSITCIQHEIAKCVVLCANCHRREHRGV